MRRTDRLNDRQLVVLRWIGEGSPPGVMSGHTHKTTARALQDRGLVRIGRRGGGWWADLTPAGRYYLDHGENASDARRREAAPRPSSSPRRARDPNREVDIPPPTSQMTTGELLELLRREGGHVTVADPAPEDRAALRRAVDALRHSGLIPDGRHLRLTGRDRGDVIIAMRTGARLPQNRGPQPTPLNVPQNVVDWHPAATQRFTDVSGEQSGRVKRVVHTLAVAADGHDVGVTSREGGLSFSGQGQNVGVRLFEVRETRDVLPDPDESDGEPRYGWQRVRPVAQQAWTGRLTIVFDDDRQFLGRRRRFADTERWRLEDKLAHVLAEAVHRLTAARTRHETAQRAEEERHQTWQTAMARAHHEFHESRRIAALDHQLGEWEQARRIRAYCDELAAIHDGADEQRTEWITWARGYADRLDPRGRRDVAPPIVEPRPDQLVEFLNGWSPYEPRRR